MQHVPPPLPRILTDPRPVIILGTVAWFIAAVVLWVTGGPADWMWTCLTGGLLGLIGYAVMRWQWRTREWH